MSQGPTSPCSYGITTSARLRVHQDQLTNTSGANYPQMRNWAEAASHGTGNRLPLVDTLDVSGLGFTWLVDTCAAMKIDVMPPFV